jgi:GTP-binding protein
MAQFVDLARITVHSGDGGNGIVAWRKEKYEPMGGPFGGTGGRGGNVYLQATRDMSTLLDFRYQKEFKAKPGERGGPKKMAGKNAPDLIIKVPQGTLVKDADTQDLIADLTKDGDKVLVAEGGRGGRGNADLVSPRNRAPYFCEPGEQGIHRTLELELKLLADVGIVGLPNAGKSTLLSVLTAARPKIADYPFSTLQPNLGVVKKSDGDGFVIADVPGLVAGASKGVGLGHQFLRHLERTRLLVHLADMGDANLEQNLATIGVELHEYSERLESLPQIIALNKADVMTEAEAQTVLERVRAKLPTLLPKEQSVIDVLTISCATTHGVQQLSDRMAELIAKAPPEKEVFPVASDPRATAHPDEGFTVYRKHKKFFVEGTRLERMVAVTNLRSPEALHHLFDVMRAMGVIEELMKAGVQPGDEVVVGGTAFNYGEDW